MTSPIPVRAMISQVRRARIRTSLCTGTRWPPSTADLKFLHHLQRVRLREFQIESGTRIIKLLVPFAFRSSVRACCGVSRTSESKY